MEELYLERKEATKTMIDNKSAQVLVKNLVFHERSKHIDIKFHFIQECITEEEVDLEFVKSLDQVADILLSPSRMMFFKN